MRIFSGWQFQPPASTVHANVDTTDSLKKPSTLDNAPLCVEYHMTLEVVNDHTK